MFNVGDEYQSLFNGRVYTIAGKSTFNKHDTVHLMLLSGDGSRTGITHSVSGREINYVYKNITLKKKLDKLLESEK